MRDSWSSFLNTDFKEKSIQEINEMLNEELKKPAKKRNYDKIEELTRGYAELMGTETEVGNAMQRCLSELKSKARPRKKITRRMRVFFTAVSVAVLLFIMNIVTVSAFDMNVFSFIVNVTNGSFSVNFSQVSSEKVSDNAIKLPVTADDPYGMIAECSKYGIYPETPHYLPDDYVLTLCSNLDMPSYSKDVDFTFTNKYNTNQYIFFTYELYKNSEYVKDVKFPNDEHRFQEITINEHPALLAEEKKDRQFTIVYQIDKLLISFSTQDMSEQEVNKIIESFY